jgi:hypothetical protein
VRPPISRQYTSFHPFLSKKEVSLNSKRLIQEELELAVDVEDWRCTIAAETEKGHSEKTDVDLVKTNKMRTIMRRGHFFSGKTANRTGRGV